MIDDPDRELVARAGRGDRTAAQALITRHMPKMMSLSQRMLGNPAEAEDAVQEAFLRLWKHASSWRPGRAKFETWLYRVTLNQCYDRLRRKPMLELEEATQIHDPQPDPEQALGEAKLAAVVREALGALPPRQKAAIALCHLEECGNIEAAEILGLSVEALESLLARGRRSLRARLANLRTELTPP